MLVRAVLRGRPSLSRCFRLGKEPLFRLRGGHGGPPLHDVFHSYRSAIMGSTLVARRAGMKLASNATPASSTEIPMKVNGS